MNSGEELSIAVVQLSSTTDVAENTKNALNMAEDAMKAGAKLVCLPENALYLGSNDNKSEVAQELEGLYLKDFVNLARRYDAYLSLGSIPELRAGDTRTYNTQVIVGGDGLKSFYRKIHLFDVEVEGLRYAESDHVAPGTRLETTQVGDFSLGLSVCYDLRFPKLYEALREKGAEILLVPAAFTRPTGERHWRVLLRARAIENQCYVVAANQCGEHTPGRASYGHSMIVDPDGGVLCELGSRPGFALAVVSKTLLKDLRSKMPVFEHRRNDIQ